MCKVLVMARDQGMIFKCLYFLYDFFSQKIIINRRILAPKQIWVSSEKLNML